MDIENVLKKFFEFAFQGYNFIKIVVFLALLSFTVRVFGSALGRIASSIRKLTRF